jgi:spore maturation protein CgeB
MAVKPGRLRVLMVTPVWKGSLGFFCQRAFERMGYDVGVFDYRSEALGKGYRALGPPGWLRIVRQKLGMALMNRRLRQVVAQFAPQLVLIIKGELVEPDTVRLLRQSGGAAVTLWYPDPSRRLTERSFRRIAEGMAHYDVTFLCDPAHVPETLRPTIRRAEYLTFACDPEYHRQVSLTAIEQIRYGSPICFVGNWQGSESPRASMLPALADYPVAIWGRGWGQTPLSEAESAVLRGPAYGDEMLKVYSASEIALNFSFDHYLIFRNFEVPGCGLLLVTEDIPELQMFFRPGEEVVTFHHTDNLRQKLDYHLAHPGETKAIAEQGQRRAYAEHTFVHRMEELLDKVFRT